MVYLNKKCLCDGTKYSYCPDCSRADALKPSWYNTFCSESCMTLWTTLTKYNMGMVSKEDARTTIVALDLKSIDTYANCVQRDYAIVMAEEKKPLRGKRVAARPVDDAIDIVLNVVETQIDKPMGAELTVDEAESHEVVAEENE